MADGEILRYGQNRAQDSSGMNHGSIDGSLWILVNYQNTFISLVKKAFKTYSCQQNIVALLNPIFMLVVLF